MSPTVLHPPMNMPIRDLRTEMPSADDCLIRPILICCLVFYMGLGFLLKTVALPPQVLSRDSRTTRVTFRMPEPPMPQPGVVSKTVPDMVPELTPETVLAQVVDLSVQKNADISGSANETPVEQKPPRRIYGVRKVFAHGLGAGSGNDGALVVKRGNTMDGKADTLTATEADLRASLAPLSTVTRAPRPLERFKPHYSDALRDAGARGIVTARLLIDTEGRVRQIEVLTDIGYDSRELVTAAFQRFRFHPALRGDEPVAVWIVHKIRFEFQE